MASGPWTYEADPPDWLEVRKAGRPIHKPVGTETDLPKDEPTLLLPVDEQSYLLVTRGCAGGSKLTYL
jgi:hypothetical protein